MGNDKFEFIVKTVVTKYINSQRTVSSLESSLIGEPYPQTEPCFVYIVWMCKTLQNNKALASTNINDGRYYEVTYNGDKDEIYLDVYEKETNVLFKTAQINTESSDN